MVAKGRNKTPSKPATDRSAAVRKENVWKSTRCVCKGKTHWLSSVQEDFVRLPGQGQNWSI